MKNVFKIELNPNRIYGLDILRALAILFVVIGHGAYLMPDERYKYINIFLFDGVSIFFVLSGFLIGGILLKTLNDNTISPGLIFNFWIRRWFRTLPNYFLILIVLLLLNFIFTEGFNVLDYKHYFIFSQNLLTVHPTFFPEAWSLSIEEWFYLIIPIVLFTLITLCKVSINNSVLITAIGVIILVTLFRYYRYQFQIGDIPSWDQAFRKQVFTRLDSIMYGVVGSYINYYFNAHWQKFKRKCLFTGLALFLVVKITLVDVDWFGLYHCVFSFSLTSLATILIIPYLSNVKKGKGFIFKGMTYISLISYSMYLINLTLVQKWMLGSIDWSFIQNTNGYAFLLTRYALYWFLTIVISILIYKYFEIPLTNLRDKINFKNVS